MKHAIDDLDKRIIFALSEDGLQSVNKTAEDLGVTGPTVRSRVKSLVSRGLLKIAGLIDPSTANELIVALVCITLQNHEQLDAKLKLISELNRVSWAAVVTGRYDIIAEVLLSGDMADLYTFLDEELSRIGGVYSSESFVVMKSRRKWVLLPSGSERWFVNSGKGGSS